MGKLKLILDVFFNRKQPRNEVDQTNKLFFVSIRQPNFFSTQEKMILKTVKKIRNCFDFLMWQKKCHLKYHHTHD